MRVRVLYLVAAVATVFFILYFYLLKPSALPSTEVTKLALLYGGVGFVAYFLFLFLASSGPQLVDMAGNRVLYDARVPAAIFALCFVGALAQVYLETRSPLLLVAIPGLTAFSILSILNVYPLKGSIQAPAGEAIAENRLVAFVSGRERLKRLATYRAERFQTLLSKAGVIGNPYITAATSLAQTIVAAFVVIPISLVLGLFIWSPLLLTGLLPALVYVYPEMNLRDKYRERKDGVEKELPFFLMLVSVLGGAGVSLYLIFKQLIGTQIFDHVRKEAMLIEREVAVFGTDPVESFEHLAASHPSRKLALFLYGYSSKVRSGGDIPIYLQSESFALMRDLEETWSRYSSKVATMGSGMITVFGIIPLLLLIVGIFSPTTSVVALSVFTAIGVPFFTILFIFFAGRMQPVGEEPLSGKPRRSFLLSLPAFGLYFVTGLQWLAAAGTLFIFLTLYGISVMRQRKERREIDEAIPEFMKDMMEFKRQEYDLTKAILVIASKNKYTSSFDKILAKIAAQMRAGIPLDEQKTDLKTRLARMVFFVFGQMIRSGGGSVDTMYQLTVYTEKLMEMKKNVQAEMRPYLVLSHLSPIMLAFGVGFINSVLKSFGNRLLPVSTLHTGLQIGPVPPELLEVSNLLIIVAAAALGLIGAKMSDFTVKNTFRASLNVVIAMIAIYALSAINIFSLFHL